MVNLNVPYSRPNAALLTLRNEVYARYGVPARPAEFVTGYKAAGNYTGHNADANGIVHAVDLFVGPGNLTPDQGAELAGALLALGPAGNVDGVPKRQTYVIHAGRIGGDFNGWTWQDYAGADPHTDHVHVSTCDLYWGDPAPIGPADYDSTAPWGIASGTLAPAGSGTITPLTEEDIMATLNDVREALRAELAGLALDGQDGVRNAGPLYPLAQDVQAIRDTLTQGMVGVRNAGPVFALLAEVAGRPAAATDPAAIAEAVRATVTAEVAADVAARLQVVAK